MSSYSEVSEDYKMFDTKAEVDFYNSIENYVSVDDMMKHMFAVLVEYDRCLDKKQDAKVNPMSGRILMRVSNGLTFEIPENIQKIAIAKYLESENKDLSGSLKKKVKTANVPVAANQELETEMETEAEAEAEAEEYIEGVTEEVQEEEQSEKGGFSFDSIKKMVPGIPKVAKEDRMKYIILTVLVLVALYSLYRYIDVMIRDGTLDLSRFNLGRIGF